MARFPGNDIISLIGDPPRYELAESIGPDLRLGELLGASGETGIDEIALGYSTAAGDPGLREAIAASHEVDPDDVVVTVGGMHALFLLAFVLCDPGDRVVTFSPAFPLGRNALDVVGADVHVLPLSFDEGYRLNPDALVEALSPTTKLVSLASPQNPSGVSVPRETLEEILAVMREKCPRAHLLVDETYREAAYGNEPVSPSAVTLDTRVVSVASLSKCHGAPGLRTGWAVTRDRELAEQLVVGKFNTVVSCSAIDEALALRVFEQRERILGDRRRQLDEGRAVTENWVSENEDHVAWVRPDAGALCCVRLKPSVFDDAGVDRFYRAIEHSGVRVADGSWFGDERRVFRLGFGLLPKPDLEVALKLIRRALQTAQAPA